MQVSDNDKLQNQLFAAIGKQDSSWMDYPGRLAGWLFSAIVLVFVGIYALRAFAVALVIHLVRWPFLVPVRRRERAKHKRELQEAGRLITLDEFERHAADSEGLVIRDLSGQLWWTPAIPEPVRQVDLRQRQSRRYVRLYQLFDLPESESDRIFSLEYASMVDLPRSKIRWKDWDNLADRSEITMLSFQFKK